MDWVWSEAPEPLILYRLGEAWTSATSWPAHTWDARTDTWPRETFRFQPEVKEDAGDSSPARLGLCRD